MKLLLKLVREFFKKPCYTGFDMVILIFIVAMQSNGFFWFTIPLWIWIIFGSTLLQNKYYTVKEKEEN